MLIIMGHLLLSAGYYWRDIALKGFASILVLNVMIFRHKVIPTQPLVIALTTIAILDVDVVLTVVWDAIYSTLGLADYAVRNDPTSLIIFVLTTCLIASIPLSRYRHRSLDRIFVVGMVSGCLLTTFIMQQVVVKAGYYGELQSRKQLNNVLLDQKLNTASEANHYCRTLRLSCRLYSETSLKDSISRGLVKPDVIAVNNENLFRDSYSQSWITNFTALDGSTFDTTVYFLKESRRVLVAYDNKASQSAYNRYQSIFWGVGSTVVFSWLLLFAVFKDLQPHPQKRKHQINTLPFDPEIMHTEYIDAKLKPTALSDLTEDYLPKAQIKQSTARAEPPIISLKSKQEV